MRERRLGPPNIMTRLIMGPERDVQIRRPLDSDIPAWLAMRQKLWPVQDEREHAADVARTRGKPGFCEFVAEERASGTLVGFIELALRPYVNGCRTMPVAFVEGIFVEE